LVSEKDSIDFLRKCFKDPVYFAEHMLFNEEGQLYQLEDHQKLMLRDKDAMKVFFLGRRMGKSLTVAMYSIWKCFFNSYYKIYILSPTQQQSRDLADTVSDMISRSSLVLDLLKTDNVFTKEFTNKSKIDFRTAGGKENTSSVIGSGVNLLIIDEAQDVSDQLFAKILPIVRGQHGRSELVLAGTPRSKRGFFFESIYNSSKIYQDDELIETDGNGLFTVFKKPTAFMNEDDQIIKSGTPRITIEELKQDLEIIDVLEFRQEYCLQFLDDLSVVYSDDLIQEAKLLDDVDGFYSTKLCVGGIDIGRQRNNSVLVIAEVTPSSTLQTKYYKAFPLGTRYQTIADYLIKILPKKFPNLRRLIFDATGVGVAFSELIEGRTSYELEEFKFSKESKKSLVEASVLALEEGNNVFIHNKKLIKEMQGYKREKTESGNIVYLKTVSDDFVDAFNLCNYNLNFPLNFRQKPFVMDTGFKIGRPQIDGDSIWHPVGKNQQKRKVVNSSKRVRKAQRRRM
jgi:ribosomal protein L21